MASSIQNLDRLLRKLDRLNVNSQKVVEKSLKKNVKLVQGEAKTLAPVDTGNLRNSIVSDVKTDGNTVIGEISTNCAYAPYVEFGTGQSGENTNNNDSVNLSYKQNYRGQAAKPFLYPALKNNEETVLKNIETDLKETISKIGGIK